MRHLSPRKALLCAAAAAALAFAASGGLSGASGTAQAAATARTIPSHVLPCDIYAAGGTPCVAAYSTVRALYSTYHGPLYQVTRASDGATADIGVLAPGGYADAAAQKAFCMSTVCYITRIYDQSPYHNDLGVGPIGGNGAADNAAIANAWPVKIGGHLVYGVNVQAGVGYRNDVTRGVATGSDPQGAYMVTSAGHVDSLCCFDFGNAETSGTDNGNGHMDAINFGTECWFSPCNGAGPWVMADMENGLFSGGNGSDTGNVGNSSTFVTAVLNNNGTTTYQIEDGNAQSGGLTSEYDGPLPDIGGYTPMHQEGAVILGTGGDNSNDSDGVFYEGVLTAGYPSAATDNAVQANIVSVGYQQVSPTVPVPGTPYVITNTNSGSALQPANCGTTDLTSVVISSVQSGSTCQEWVFSNAGSGHYTVTNVSSGLVLDDLDCATGYGAALDTYSSLGNTCQEWDVTPNGPHYTISGFNSGEVLDVEDCDTANGTSVRQWHQLDNACQQWDFTPAS
jgi:hypothetical protein